MYVKELRLSGFRNYKEESFSFCSGTNIIYGNNAQGKTNALEAVYLFSIGKSFRTQQDRELIRFDEAFTKIDVCFDDAQRENEIEIVVRRDRKKQIKINGVPINKMGELIGCCHRCLVFTGRAEFNQRLAQRKKTVFRHCRKPDAPEILPPFKTV